MPSISTASSENSFRTGQFLPGVDVGENRDAIVLEERVRGHGLDTKEGEKTAHLHVAPLYGADQSGKAASVIDGMHGLKSFLGLGNDYLFAVYLADDVPDGRRGEKRHVAAENEDVRGVGVEERRHDARQRPGRGQGIPDDPRLDAFDGAVKARYYHDVRED